MADDYRYASAGTTRSSDMATAHILGELSEARKENIELKEENRQLVEERKADNQVNRIKNTTATLSAIGTGVALAMDNPVGKWIILQAKDFVTGGFSFDLAKILSIMLLESMIHINNMVSIYDIYK